MRTLIIGFGNPLRGDDGVGWYVAAHAAEHLNGAHVRTVACSELLAGLADVVREADLVVFVEAGYGATGGEVMCTPVQPESHVRAPKSAAVSPEQLLAMARRDDGGCRWPAAFLLTVTGSSFGPGDGLSPAVRHACPAVLKRIASLVLQQGGAVLTSHGVPVREMYGYA